MPWLVLAAGTAGTALLWHETTRRVAEHAYATLEAEADAIERALERKALAHEEALRTAAALIANAGTGADTLWQAMVRQSARADAMTGTTALGYRLYRGTELIADSQSMLVASDSATIATRRRAQDLPEALGASLAGAQRARVISDPSIVPPGPSGRPGLMMATSIAMPRLPAERSTSQVSGYVYSILEPFAFVSAALPDVRRIARFEITERDAASTTQPLFSEFAKSGADGNATSGSLHTERTVRIADRTWLMKARAPAAGSGAMLTARWMPIVAAMGTLLAFGVTLLCSILGFRAVRAANEGAEESRRAAERLTSLFNTAPDAIVGLDRTGMIVTFNHAAEHMFRVNHGEAIGQPLSIIVPGMDIERITHALSDGLAVYESGFRTARIAVTAERRGGMRFPVELDLGELVDDQTSHITCIARDVTEARRAEEEMRLYKRAIASSSNGIAIADVTLPDHPILYVNPSFERVTGYDLADALGRNCRFLQGPDTDPGAIAKIRSAIARGMECQVTLKNYMKNGTPFWNHLTLAPVRDRGGRVTHYIGIETDVTEIKQIEAALDERRQQLDAIFTLSPDGFVAIGRDHRISYANPSFLRIANLEHAELQGAPIERLDELLKSGSDPANPFTPFAQLLTEMGAGRGNSREVFVATSRVQDTVFLRNPTPKILLRSIRRATAGGATEFVMYLRDVTREMEVDRMKSEFLSSAAHELRTPMASIYGFTELLLRRNFDENTRRDLLQTIHKQAKHLTNLVNELLDLARIEARAGKDLKLEEQSLLPLIHETIDALLVQNDERKVEVTLPATLPTVRIDSGKMRQALTNILSNAYKYSPAGGRIELTTEIRSAGDRDFLGVRVRDEGIGMSPEQLAHACERFYRADTSGNIPGTGLGLSLVKEIMELQGGSIELQSESGKGTTVTLWLPVMHRLGVRAA